MRVWACVYSDLLVYRNPLTISPDFSPLLVRIYSPEMLAIALINPLSAPLISITSVYCFTLVLRPRRAPIPHNLYFFIAWGSPDKAFESHPERGPRRSPPRDLLLK